MCEGFHTTPRVFLLVAHLTGINSTVYIYTSSSLLKIEITLNAISMVIFNHDTVSM